MCSLMDDRLQSFASSCASLNLETFSYWLDAMPLLAYSGTIVMGTNMKPENEAELETRFSSDPVHQWDSTHDFQQGSHSIFPM